MLMCKVIVESGDEDISSVHAKKHVGRKSALKPSQLRLRFNEKSISVQKSQLDVICAAVSQKMKKAKNQTFSI